MPSLDSFETREDYLEYYRQYREKNREKLRVYNLKYNKNYRKKHNYRSETLYAKKWRKENPNKYKAQLLLRYALKVGIIKKSPCVFCGRKYRVLGHHPDYNQPLNVIWVCDLHHKHIHLGKISIKKQVDKLFDNTCRNDNI